MGKEETLACRPRGPECRGWGPQVFLVALQIPQASHSSFSHTLPWHPGERRGRGSRRRDETFYSRMFHLKALLSYCIHLHFKASESEKNFDLSYLHGEGAQKEDKITSK